MTIEVQFAPGVQTMHKRILAGATITHNEVVDTAIKHLQAQNAFSWVDGTESCAYRDGKGHACAVGAFIPDRFYNPKCEGFGVWSLTESNNVGSVRIRSFITRHRELLENIQGAYDNEATQTVDEPRMGRVVAKLKKLRQPFVRAV